MDELSSLLLGGDGFVTKPYHTAILLAQIAALLKRAYPHQPDPALTWRGATLHLDRSQLTYQEATADLTRNELKILAYLFRHAGTICARGDLVSYLWDNQVYVDDNCPQRQHRSHPGEAGRHRPDGLHPDQAPPGVSDMNGPLYWKGQLPVILLQLAAMVGLALLLLLGGMNGDSVALILLLWALIAALWLVRGYVLRKRQLEALLELARQLPEAYLLGEVMPAPTRADDQVFYHCSARPAGPCWSR